MSQYQEILTLIAYLNSDPTGPERRLNAAPPPRRVAVTILLDWLLDRAEGAARIALPLSAGAAWLGEVTMLVKTSAVLGRLFQVTQGELDFRSDIGEDERRNIERFVAEHYRPPLFDG